MNFSFLQKNNLKGNILLEDFIFHLSKRIAKNAMFFGLCSQICIRGLKYPYQALSGTLFTCLFTHLFCLVLLCREPCCTWFCNFQMFCTNHTKCYTSSSCRSFCWEGTILKPYQCLKSYLPSW